MKKIVFLLLASFLVLGACGNKEDSKVKDNKQSASSNKKDKKSNNSKTSNKEAKSNNDDNESNAKQETASNEDSTSNDNTKSNSDDTSTNNNKQTENNNSNVNTQGNQSQVNHQSNQTASNQNNQQVPKASNNQTNDNQLMSDAEIAEWNKNKPTTHDESQMGYGRGDYEQAKEETNQVAKDPNAHVGGPRWVGKNEGYESWRDRQQSIQNSQQ